MRSVDFARLYGADAASTDVKCRQTKGVLYGFATVLLLG